MKFAAFFFPSPPRCYGGELIMAGSLASLLARDMGTA